MLLEFKTSVVERRRKASLKAQSAQRKASERTQRRNLEPPSTQRTDRKVRKAILKHRSGLGARRVLSDKNGRPTRAQANSSACALEELHRFFVLHGGSAARKCAQVFALAGFLILLARVEAVFARFQFADHAAEMRERAGRLSGSGDEIFGGRMMHDDCGSALLGLQ